MNHLLGCPHKLNHPESQEIRQNNSSVIYICFPSTITCIFLGKRPKSILSLPLIFFPVLALGKELQHLSHIQENVEDKLELRRKQLHVLLSAIHELQQTLENDEKLSEAEEPQETQMETETKQQM